MAPEMSGCPVGTTAKPLANGGGERNEDLARQCQRRRLSDRESYRPRIAKEGGDRMTDYELLMIVFTVLSLVVALITKDQK